MRHRPAPPRMSAWPGASRRTSANPPATPCVPAHRLHPDRGSPDRGVSLMSTATVLQVNLAVPEKSDAKNVGITGINKQPVDHPVAVRAPGPKRTGLHSGLVGDQIFDIDHHGGDDQAVYAYAREDYDWWERELGRELPGGLFGENLTTEGLDVNGAILGETWRIGDELVLQTTFGRVPCATFQWKMREPRWVKRFAAERRPG